MYQMRVESGADADTEIPMSGFMFDVKHSYFGNRDMHTDYQILINVVTERIS